MTRWIRVLWALGSAFALHLLRRAFGSAPEGCAVGRYLATFGAEGLFPLTDEERRVLPALARCVGCGLCLSQGPTLPPNQPDVLLSASRLLPERPVVARSLAAYRRARGPAASWVAGCPVGAPFEDALAIVRGGAAPPPSTGRG